MKDFNWEGYDAWRTTDVDAERAGAYAEYMARVATYEMACCGYALGVGEDADVTFDRDGQLQDRVCPNPECCTDLDLAERAEPQAVIEHIPEQDDGEDDRDDREDR